MTAETEEKTTVLTWDELEDRALKLAEFYATAVDASEVIAAAAGAKSEIMLRKALSKFQNLKAPPTFRVSSEIYRSTETEPIFRLVN